MIGKIIAVQILIATSALRAPAQTVSVKKAQLGKDIWIANAKYNIDTSGKYELVAIAAGLHAAFAADPKLNTAQGLAIVHNAMAAIDSWKSTQGATANPADIYQKALSLMADAATSTSVKAAAGIGKDLLAFIPESAPENDWRMINAFRSSEFSVDRTRESQILDSVYTDALTSPALRNALDRGIGPQLKGLTTDSAATLLDHNPGLAQGIGIKNLTDLVKSQGDSVKLSLGDIKDDLNAHLSDLTNVVKEDTSVLSEMNRQQADIKAYLADAAAQQRAAEVAQKQQKLDQLRLEAADAAFQVFGRLIGGKAGSQVAATGQVAVKVAGAISNFVNNTSKLSTGLGAAVLTGNLLSAAIDLGGIFGGPSDTEVISGQLTQLSSQIADMQKDMDTRFDRVDGELAQIYDQVNNNFQEEMKAIQGLDVKLDLVREDLLGLAQQLNGIENVLLEALKNIESQAFISEHGEYYGYYQQKNSPMSQPQFDDAEKIYFGAVSLGNVPPQVDSNSRAAVGDGTIVRALRGSADSPIYTALRPDEINLVLSVAGAAPAGGPLVNPQLWVVATSAYLDLASQPVRVSGKGRGQKVQSTFICKASKAADFAAAGTRLKTAMTNVALATDSKAGATKNPIFSVQLDGYSAALESLFAELNRRRADEIKELQYDPWLPLDQATNAVASLGANAVTLCGANATDIGSGISLANVGLAKGLFANASHFTQKDNGISICITDLSYSTNILKQVITGFHPHRYAPSKYLYTLAISGSAHLRYRQIDFATCAFTSDPVQVFRAWGAPVPDIHTQVVSQWANIAAKIQGGTFVSTNGDGGGKATDLAAADIGALFADSRKKLIAEAWYIPSTQSGQGKSEPQASLAKLADYKSMLWALAQIGLPSSFDSDEVFHSYLSDTDRGLLDRLSFINKLGYLLNKASGDEVQHFDVVAYENQARSTLGDFQSLLSSKLTAEVRAGGDLPEGIAGGLAGLEKANEAYAACRKH